MERLAPESYIAEGTVFTFATRNRALFAGVLKRSARTPNDRVGACANVIKFNRKTCEESTGKLLSMSDMQAWDADRAQARIRELEHLPGALLPILHALQEEFGYIDR